MGGEGLTELGFYIGTSGYNFDDWVGSFYQESPWKKDPKQTDRRRLIHYQTCFSFLEISIPHDRAPIPTSFAEIEAASKENMLYSVRVHSDLTTINRSWDPERGKSIVANHIEAVGPLVETGRFYSFLLQVEEEVHRSQKRLDYLVSVASTAVHQRISVHIEFRHNSWHCFHVLRTLKDNGIGICNTDLPKGKHVFPRKDYATTDRGYIRYHGQTPNEVEMAGATVEDGGGYLYSEAEVRDRTSGQIALSRKVNSLAVVFTNHTAGNAVRNAGENVLQIQQELAKSQIEE